MTIKESFDIAGYPTTWGDPAFKDAIVKTDSLYVQRMRRAGVTLFGKTNVPLNLADWQSYNEVYGSTNNPWDLGRTPGGSGRLGRGAGHSLTGIAGSDIGSSIRPRTLLRRLRPQPTGVVCPRAMHLPQRRYGLGVFRWRRRTSRFMDAIAGPTRSTAGAPPAAFKRVACSVDPNAEVDNSVQAETEACRLSSPAEDQGERQGAATRNERVFIRMLRAATSARMTDAVYEQALADAKSLPASDMSYFAQMQRGNSLAHRTWLQLNEKRHRMRLAWDAFFQDYDLMLCPVAVTAAFPHDQKGLRHLRTIVVNNKKVPVVDQIFWAGYAGLTYLPASAAPIGQTADGLPIGVQIIGPQYGDYDCIQFAKLLEKEYRSFEPPPAYS
jgi:amidase